VVLGRLLPPPGGLCWTFSLPDSAWGSVVPLPTLAAEPRLFGAVAVVAFDPADLLFQTVTYWAAASNGFGGFTYSAPVRMKGRWEDINETFVDNAGREFVSQAKVWTQFDVGMGGYLGLGTLTDVAPPAGAYQIRAFLRTPSVDAQVFERMAVL
jgi:hypothetical protein